jgi:hypothetical protein
MDKPWNDSSLSARQWLENISHDCDFVSSLRKCLHEPFTQMASGIPDAPASNLTKLYWLLLRLVFASSRLRTPKAAWIYRDCEGVGSNKAPDNFCCILQAVLHSSVELFSTYKQFHLMIFYYFEGLCSSYAIDGDYPSIQKRFDWVRNRPLLGVPKAVEKFRDLLQMFENVSQLLNMDIAKSGALEIGLPPLSEEPYQKLRVRT